MVGCPRPLVVWLVPIATRLCHGEIRPRLLLSIRAHLHSVR
jgi:hypothetical protein